VLIGFSGTHNDYLSQSYQLKTKPAIAGVLACRMQSRFLFCWLLVDSTALRRFCYTLSYSEPLPDPQGQRGSSNHEVLLPISSWSELRATLPEHLQLKIADRCRQLRPRAGRSPNPRNLLNSRPPICTAPALRPATLEREWRLLGSSFLNTCIRWVPCPLRRFGKSLGSFL